ncbi:MAG: hypothetical protein ACOH18_02815 [Candidatus Saccharimonadaceae bacterium]
METLEETLQAALFNVNKDALVRSLLYMAIVEEAPVEALRDQFQDVAQKRDQTTEQLQSSLRLALATLFSQKKYTLKSVNALSDDVRALLLGSNGEPS